MYVKGVNDTVKDLLLSFFFQVFPDFLEQYVFISCNQQKLNHVQDLFKLLLIHFVSRLGKTESELQNQRLDF